MSISEYSKSIEQIAAGLVHEVKNPLSLVKANIDLLELMDSEKLYKENYDIIKREIDRINDLLLDFIQFTKPIEPIPEKVDIEKLILDIAGHIKTTFRSELNITIDFMNDELYALCDESKIRRVLVNIIKNSIEAIDNNKGEINITVLKQNEYIKIIVKDNGIGLCQDQIKQITSPFYTTKHGGSGLGLFITKSIVEEHNGLFEICGEKNEGCTVTVMLPKL